MHLFIMYNVMNSYTGIFNQDNEPSRHLPSPPNSLVAIYNPTPFQSQATINLPSVTVD